MPHLICTPYTISETQPDEFEVTIDSGTPESSTPQTLGDDSVRLYYDVVGLSTGVSHNASVVAILNDIIYGELRSGTATLDFILATPYYINVTW